MKILVDKHEYAKLIRGCYNSLNADGCLKCALIDICVDGAAIEDMAEIVEWAAGTDRKEQNGESTGTAAVQ